MSLPGKTTAIEEDLINVRLVTRIKMSKNKETEKKAMFFRKRKPWKKFK